MHFEGHFKTLAESEEAHSPVKSSQYIYTGGQLLATSLCVDSGNHWQYADKRTVEGGNTRENNIIR